MSINMKEARYYLALASKHALSAAHEVSKGQELGCPEFSAYSRWAHAILDLSLHHEEVMNRFGELD